MSYIGRTFIAQQATEDLMGVVEKATEQEAIDGAIDKFPDARGVSRQIDERVGPLEQSMVKDEWENIDSLEELSRNTRYAVTFSSNGVLTLPLNPLTNDFVEIYRSSGDSTGSIIARNGHTIMGLAEDLELDYNITSLHLVYNGSDWRIV